ncbi:glycogen synthase [Rubricoccus marinus]|uniref:Glycogen synthase n=1 Tax=Rubricoccus marinus TaxID=716817 RepID=A0A259U1G3_9BACT|nr:glycogen synthase [Rubricoccus marinus]OZC03687.1 hypothetical protein BSZ36_12260 [Rubricoccus marinus]
MTVLHLAAECAPFAKVGGLADVVGALPGALAGLGVQSAGLMPLYGGPEGAVATKAGPLARVAAGEIRYGEKPLAYAIYRAEREDGAPLFLLHQPEHFGAEGVYFGPGNLPFENADDRFPVFQLAALDWLAAGEGFSPDVLHLHDHHVGFVPALLKHDARFSSLATVPTVFTVHSADHQGWAPEAVWKNMGAPEVPSEAVRLGGTLNSMKAALRYADAVTTVSPSYAQELQADDEMAHGLAHEFRAAADRFTGIVNGVDTSEWDPATDRHLPAPFSAADLSGKAETQRAVRAELGVDARGPLLTFVGRLMREKGAEILPGALARILEETDARIALLGSGAPEYEAQMRRLASGAEASRLSVTLAFDNALAHRLYAAGDFFLMPSRSEPCGLGQLYAMGYGTPPIVHAVGGLRDTVRPWDGEAGVGFAFDAFTEDAFVDAVRRALDVFAAPEAYRRLQHNGMAADHSWAASASAYVHLYNALGA